MAQTGYTPISIYYSSTATNVPTAGNLVAGELAINTADGKLFYKDSAGVVQVIGTKGGVGSSTTTQVLYNSSGLVVGSANMTFSGTALTLANDLTVNTVTVGHGGGNVAHNVVVGNTTIPSGATGDYNNAFGWNTLHALTTGASNQAFGNAALYANTTGGSNTAIGETALFSNTTASNNTALGYQAGYTNSTGTDNTYVGYQTCYSLSGSFNTAIGSGHQGGGATGSYNTFVGNKCGLNANDSNSLIIGSLNGSVLYGKGSNTGFISPNSGGVYQGNNSATWSITSDARLKKNIVDNNTGLSVINAIQVRNFEYRLPEEITELEPTSAISRTGVQLGVIAQEIAQVSQEFVKTESTGVMSVDTDNLVWYLINAVKELKAEIDQLKGK